MRQGFVRVALSLSFLGLLALASGEARSQEPLEVEGETIRLGGRRRPDLIPPLSPLTVSLGLDRFPDMARPIELYRLEVRHYVVIPLLANENYPLLAENLSH